MLKYDSPERREVCDVRLSPMVSIPTTRDSIAEQRHPSPLGVWSVCTGRLCCMWERAGGFGERCWQLFGWAILKRICRSAWSRRATSHILTTRPWSTFHCSSSTSAVRKPAGGGRSPGVSSFLFWVLCMVPTTVSSQYRSGTWTPFSLALCRRMTALCFCYLSSPIDVMNWIDLPFERVLLHWNAYSICIFHLALMHT